MNAPFCRVQGSIKPSSDSDIAFEVWLPPQAGWNSKYEGVGNGGFAGSLIYPSMDWALEGGLRGVGHRHRPCRRKRWMRAGLSAIPRRSSDFGWRGIHETAAASKAIIEAYYGKAPARAYFAGCSDGGREALMEAQRFPKDYDGIVAGAPANFWTRLLTNGVWTDEALSETPDSWLSPEKLSVVTDAALKACHGENGVLDDPGAVPFRSLEPPVQSGRIERMLVRASDRGAEEDLFGHAGRLGQVGLSRLSAGRRGLVP